MMRVPLILLGLTLMAGCLAMQPTAPEPASGDSGVVAPVVAPEVMTFALPFRGVTYRMTIEEGQGNVPGTVYASPDKAVDAAVAKDAVMNACAFVGRFPNPATTGTTAAGSGLWQFDHACL